MSIERRVFVKQGAIALVALGLPPRFLARTLFAESRREGRQKTVLFIFQRGAVDGLSMVVPYGEKAYYGLRRSIALERPQRGAEGAILDLDGFFGLHPSLAPLAELFSRREMAIVHACGSPHPTRSHFDAQDFMETGTPGFKSTRDGWLNRLLSETACECSGRTLANPSAHAADHASGQLSMAEASALRGISVGTPQMPRALAGSYPTLSIPDLRSFGVAGGRDPALEAAFRRMYRTDSGDLVAGPANESFEAIDILKRADPLKYHPREGVEYPAGRFGQSLRQVAQLIKADVGLEVAFTDIGGWDTHFAQGGAQGPLANRLREFARGIRAFYEDLGDRMEDVVLVTMSEFGRTVAENGSGGTDHGHGNCMFVLGGATAGGRVVGDWPGLEREQLYEGRDLAITTDFRDVFSEVVSDHLGARSLDRVFPGFASARERWRGLLAAR